MARSHFGALRVITLVFAIIAAVVLGIGALYTTAVTLLDFGITLMFKGFTFDFNNIISSALNFGLPLLTAIAMIFAAVLLVTDREGSLLFLPMGFISGTATMSLISNGSIIVLAIATKGAILDEPSFLSGGTTIIPLLFFVFVTGTFSAMGSAKKMEDYRFIPMAGLVVTFVLGAAVSFGIGGLGLYNGVVSVLDGGAISDLISFANIENAVMPILRSGTLVFAAVAGVFATVAVISYDK